jgi:hypothetical protein
MRQRFPTGIARRELLDRLGRAFRTANAWHCSDRFGGRGYCGILSMLELGLLPVLRAWACVSATRKDQ